MPHLQGTAIIRAWRHAGEVDRIHFMLKVGTSEKHLYADKSSKGGLYDMLDAELLKQGYTGPASAVKEKV